MGDLAGFGLGKVVSVIFHVYPLKHTNSISPFEYVTSANSMVLGFGIMQDELAC
jgi:hypothetical protein